MLEIAKIHAKLLGLIEERVNLKLRIGHVDVDEVVANVVSYFLERLKVDAVAIDGVDLIITKRFDNVANNWFL